MTQNFKVLLDSPATQMLALGYNELADAFSDVIQTSDPRFAIGLFGGWGSGKTTLMQAIRARLDPASCASVWFSAWRYEKEEHLIVPLLDVVREGLVQWSERNQAADAATRAMAERVAGTVGRAIHSLLAGFSLKAGIPGGPEVTFDANKALAKHEQLSEEQEQARIPRSFYHASFAALRAAFQEFTGPNQERRIVVFVDDLDRCLAEGALEVLESMKLFFDLPGFVFVVGLDRKVVEMSVDKRYRALLPEGTERAEHISGAQYLRKIFQVPYTLAPVSTAQIDEYLHATQDAAALPPEQWSEILQHARPHLDYLASEGGVNPREIKRYVNAYTLVRKTRSWLDKDVVLALQTIAFRPDWSSLQLSLLVYRDVFLDALRRQIDDPGGRHLANLNPDLASLPQGFANFMSDGSPGRALYNHQGPIDEFIYGGEATRSSLNPEFINLFRESGRLVELAQDLETEADISQFQSQVQHVSSIYEKVSEGRNDPVSAELRDLIEARQLKAFVENENGAPDSPGEADRLEQRKREAAQHLLTQSRRVMAHLQDVYQASTL